MIPPTSWLTLMIDAIEPYSVVVSPSAQRAILDLISEIQADAQAQIVEDLQAVLTRRAITR